MGMNTQKQTMEVTRDPRSFQVFDTQNVTSVNSDVLQKVVTFIITNKKNLSSNMRQALFDAFGKAPEKESKLPKTRPCRQRATEARERISKARENDIVRLSESLTPLTRIKETPSDFWITGLSNKLLEGANFFRQLYHSNRENDRLVVSYRAFYTTATYLFIQEVCKAFNVKILTDRVLTYCTSLIDPDKEENTDLMKSNLKMDYKAGITWNAYAEHLGGYGAYFLIGVAPAWVFEITLNRSDDLQFAVSHFKSINVPLIAANHDLHKIGSDILSEIKRNVEPYLPKQTSQPKAKYKINKQPRSSFLEHRIIHKTLKGNNGSRTFINKRGSQKVQASQGRNDSNSGQKRSTHIHLCSQDMDVSSQELLAPPGRDALAHVGRASQGTCTAVTPRHFLVSTAEIPYSGHPEPCSTTSYNSVDAFMSGEPNAEVSGITQRFATAENAPGMKDPQPKPVIHGIFLGAHGASSQVDALTQSQSPCTALPMNAVDVSSNDVSNEQTRIPSVASTSNFPVPAGFSLMDSTICLESSLHGIQAETVTRNNTAPVCYQDMQSRPLSSHDEMNMELYPDQLSGLLRNGFLDVSQAFQTFTGGDGFDNTTQAMWSHIYSTNNPIIDCNAGADFSRNSHIEGLPAPGTQESNGSRDSRNEANGYHSVSEAVELFPLYGFANANTAIQDNWGLPDSDV